MNNGTEIKYNKEQISYGIEELKRTQKELYEADVLFYKAVMALATSKGIDLILREDGGINLYTPEKIVIECREEISHLIEDITAKVSLVEGFNEEPKEASETQYRKAETTEDYKEFKSAVKIGTGTAIGIGGKEQLIEVGTGDNKLIAQPMYGVPNPPEDMIVQPDYGIPTPPEDMVQPKYGAPCVPTPPEDMIVQPDYGIPTPPEDMIVQPDYGIPTPPETGPIAQPMYGVPTPPETGPIAQPMYGVPTPPETGPIAQPMYGVPTPVPEYEPIYDVQPKYGAPCIPGNDLIVQPAYGVPTPVPEYNPIYDVQPKYGAPCMPIETPIYNPAPIPTESIQPVYEPIGTIQPVYPTPTESIQPVYEPIGTIQPVYEPTESIQPVYPTTPQLHMTNEYESIPNTGIPGVIEQNYVSKHPKLIGGVAATMGLFGIPTILSDDFDEEEEKKYNEKNQD